VLAHRFHQLVHLLMRQEGGRAATEVQLCDLSRTAQRSRLHFDLFGQVIQILGRASMILGNDLVAGAVVADRVTERDVEV